SPVYLFWGRAFLIETTAVFLALTMVALALWGFEKRSYSLLIAAGVVGILGALCKAPTWGLAVGVTFLLLLIRADVYRRENWYWACGAIVAVALGFFAAKYWVAWSDAVKQANPFARELITLNSENQRAWNYGTLEQKLNIKTWEVIFQHAIEGVLVKVPFLGAFFLPLVIIFAGALYPYRALQMGAFVIAFLAGPLIFTNLYFQHSYYWIAYGACLLLGMGVAFSAIEEGVEEGGNWIAAGIGFVAVSFGFVNWNAIYKPILDALPTRSQLAEVWTEPVQKFVPKERTLLVVGNDWNSNSLYYCDRKGIAFPNFYKIPFPGPQLAESLANLQPHESLGAVVVAEPLFNQNKMIFEEFLKTHGFSLNGIQTAFGILFPANTFAEKKGE
ncbi:MAG: hypothetical protein NZL93_06570, partial [Chthoniobacterales bacterium]|nr:hypothetical protein [Chthoniobacterales bacterium]